MCIICNLFVHISFKDGLVKIYFACYLRIVLVLCLFVYFELLWFLVLLFFEPCHFVVFFLFLHGFHLLDNLAGHVQFHSGVERERDFFVDLLVNVNARGVTILNKVGILLHQCHIVFYVLACLSVFKRFVVRLYKI